MDVACLIEQIVLLLVEAVVQEACEDATKVHKYKDAVAPPPRAAHHVHSPHDHR